MITSFDGISFKASACLGLSTAGSEKGNAGIWIVEEPVAMIACWNVRVIGSWDVWIVSCVGVWNVAVPCIVWMLCFLQRSWMPCSSFFTIESFQPTIFLMSTVYLWMVIPISLRWLRML